jgi:hypothetical protein
MAKVLDFGAYQKRDKPASLSNGVSQYVDEEMFPIIEKPAAKSSTSALIAQGGTTACVSCGCRDDAWNVSDVRVSSKKDCKCKCHK